MPANRDLVRENAQLLETVELFSERLAELELAIEDVDWIRMTLEGQAEFSNSGLKKIIFLARLAFLKNPLINRAVSVQAFYVWGQGVNIEGRPADIDPVVQAFLDHPKNQTELTSHQARTGKEIQLQLEANLFFVLFTNDSTGRVTIRTIPVDEVLTGDIITDPEDRKTTWFYKRVWTQRTFNMATGSTDLDEKIAYYPDWRHRPDDKPDTIGADPILWDQPVYHVKVGGLPDMRFGVPEVYSALDWAKAVTKDLERYATLRAALARWAHKLTTEGGPEGVAAAKAKLGTTLGNQAGSGVERNPPPVTGSTFISTGALKLEAMQTRNALPDPDDGRRLGLMVAAGTGIPETMLFGDADVGNLATSKTLDRPTELKMLDRQTLWADVLKDILGYVVEQAAERANGPLAGIVTVIEDPDEPGLTRLELGNDDDGEPIIAGYDVTFPSILERDVVARVDAIVKAATLDGKTPAGTLDLRTLVRELLEALGMDDTDELLDVIAPEDQDPAGWFGPPKPAPVIVAPPAPGQPGVPAQQPPAGEDTYAEALRDVRAAVLRLVEREEVAARV